MKDKNVDDSIDAAELARFARGYSCASLEKVVNDAGLHAGYAGRELISQEDLIQSCLRTFYGMKTDEKAFPDVFFLRKFSLSLDNEFIDFLSEFLLFFDLLVLSL